jgi:hypothetical protein
MVDAASMVHGRYHRRMNDGMQEFSYRSARSSSLLIGFGIALLVEAVEAAPRVRP